MTWILIGALFSVLNFNIPISSGAIGVLPDTLGYILMIAGMLSLEKRMQYLPRFFQKSRWIAALLAFMSAWDYLRTCMGWGMGGREIMILWGTAQVFLVYSCWQGIIFGIAEIQKREDVELKARALLKSMSIMVLVKALGIVMLTFGGMIIYICAVVEIIVGLSFVIQVFYTKRRYDKSFLLQR